MQPGQPEGQPQWSPPSPAPPAAPPHSPPQLAQPGYPPQPAAPAAPPPPSTGKRTRGPLLWVAIGVVAVVALAACTVGGLVVFYQLRDDSATVSCRYEARAGGGTGPEAPKPPAQATVGPQRMLITTNRGTIEISLAAEKAPCAVNALRSLATNGYYNGSACHRLTDSGGLFILQCGDPTGNGTGEPPWRYPDENLPTEDPAYPRGTVAIANSGPGSNGGQFFISYRDNAVSPDYPVVGRVVRGMEIVDAVAAGGHDGSLAGGEGGGHPKLPLTLISVKVSDDS